jgi:drug/metabolite transporter (DMT)-like permease
MPPPETTTTPGESTGRVSRGALWMIGSAAAFAVMSALVKSVGTRLPSQEIVLARACVSLGLSYALLRQAGVPMLGQRRGLLALRGVFGFLGLSCVFAAVTRLPLAEATVLQYMHPTFTALLAWLVLGERASARSLVASAVSLLGVAFVSKPSWAMELLGLAREGVTGLDPVAVGFGLAGAFFSAAAYVTVRRLSATEHPLVIVMYFPLVAVPATLPTVASQLIWPTPLEWLALLGIGAAAQAGQVWLTRGLSLLPASRGTALSYVQVVFAAAIGLVFFAEPIHVNTVIGALLVIGGTLAVSLRPRREPRKA